MAGEPRDFGPYHLVRRLGVGGMAETFEATRIGAGGFEQRVCLKRVLPAFSDDREFVNRFRREATLAAQLRHTNIVGVIDFGHVDGIQYMALELVDGVNLRSLLKSSTEETLSAEIVALIGFDLAHALEHAHGSLVHRDISPSNILLSRSGETKLADFGIAKAIDDAMATASRSAKGKIPYMSPEHMRGEAVDGRADLFSLGVVLFEAASGVRPFDGAHDVETMQRILDGDRRPLEELAPDLPVPLREIIERLIETNRDARTPSATRLIEELATVAPPPEVRRRLATRVEGYRGGPKARLHVRAREEERDTELGRPPGLVQAIAERDAAPRQPSTRTRGRVLVLAGALLMLLVTAAAASQWLKQSAQTSKEASASVSAPTSVQVSVPASAPEPVSVPVPASVPGPEPGSEPASGSASVPVSVPAPEPAPALAPGSASVPVPAPAHVAKGWLRVVVHPWGNVWIDDVWMGRAPVKARVSKGRHVVQAGRDLPSKTRIVRVAPGARQEIEISLSD